MATMGTEKEDGPSVLLITATIKNKVVAKRTS